MEINVTPKRKLNLLKINFVGAYTFCMVTIKPTLKLRIWLSLAQNRLTKP